MILKLVKFLKISATSFIIFLLLYLACNILIVAAAGTILKNFNSDQFEISIGKINSILLPFYLDASDISIRFGTFTINANKINGNISYKRFYSNKPFISLKTDGLKFDLVPKKNLLAKTTNDFSIIEYISTIRNIELNDTKISSNFADINCDININYFIYDGTNGRYQMDLGNSVIKRNDQTEIISGRSEGKITGQSIELNNLNIKGTSIYILSEGLVISKTGAKGEISATLGSNLLKILYPGISGSMNMRGKVNEDYIAVSFATENMALDGKTIDVKGRAAGHLPGKIDFKIEDMNVLGYSFKLNGNYDTSTTYLQTKIDFLKPINIYKGHGWHVYINDADISGKVSENNLKVKTEITSAETYQVEVNAVFDLANSLVKLENLKGVSASSTLTGSAVSDFKSIIINAKGHVKNNGEVIKILKLEHEADVELVFSVDFKHLQLKGTFFSDTPQKLYNIGVDEVEGMFDLTYKGIDFTADAKLDEGSLDIVGNVNFKAHKSKFDFDIKKVYFTSILDYFKLDTSIDIPITGKAVVSIADGEVFSGGEFTAYHNYFPANSINYSFSKGILSIDSLRLEDKEVLSPVLFDFNQMKIEGIAKLDSYRYRTFPEINDIYLKTFGEISDPQFEGSFFLNIPDLGESKIGIRGDIHNLEFELDREDILIGVDVNIEKDKNLYNSSCVKEGINCNITSTIKLNKYLLDNASSVTATSEILVYSDDYKQFYGKTKSFDIQKEDTHFYVDNVTFESNLESISRLNGISKGPWWKNIYIRDFNISKNKTTGVIDFTGGNIVSQNINFSPDGTLYLFYDYKKPVQMFGEVSILGEMVFEPLKLRFPVDKGKISFFGEKIDLKILGSELNMDYKVEYNVDKYTDYLIADFKFDGRNIYLSSKGMSSVIDIKTDYLRDKRVLNSEIYLVNSKLLPVVSEIKIPSTNTVSVPFDIYANIKTRNAVVIENDMIKAALNIDLDVRYVDAELILDGKIKSSEAFLNIAGNRFIVDESFLSFRPGIPPYMYIEADGVGVQRSVHLKVDGFLPDYNVELRDRNPNNTNHMEVNSSILKQNGSSSGESKFIITEIMNGAILSSVINVSEKLFGINRIGFEENSYQGESSDYVKVGKRFSDRLELKYVIGTGRDDNNAIVGEYLLLDWIKVIVYSAVDGGNGAGFTFFTNY